MLIRMTLVGTNIAALVTALVATGGGVLGSTAEGEESPAPRTALVIDAESARDGRDLLDDRLDGVDAEVRVARTAQEARTNVRYFAEQGYDIVVAGATSATAASEAGVSAERAGGLPGALAAAGR
jgi:hypothetical protein